MAGGCGVKRVSAEGGVRAECVVRASGGLTSAGTATRMSEWYEVFDDERGLHGARARVGRRAVVFGIMGVALAASAFTLPEGGGDKVALIAGLASATSALWLVQGLRAIRDLVWCVKLSVRRVIGYDLTQKRMALAWPDVDCVEIDKRGMLIRGRDETGAACRLRVAPEFPDYVRLAHRFVDYAEAYSRPVYIDGRPWQLIDLAAVYPFLGETVAIARGPTADGSGEYVE